MRYKFIQAEREGSHPSPAPGTASDPLAPGHAWVNFMASKSFALGHANDQLVEICCLGIKAISLTGRELRRAAQREARKEAKQSSKK